jgi:hypothetical protein
MYKLNCYANALMFYQTCQFLDIINFKYVTRLFKLDFMFHLLAVTVRTPSTKEHRSNPLSLYS